MVTPYGEIPWNEVARITQDEMKLIMQEAVNKTYTILLRAADDNQEFISYIINYSEGSTYHWDTPKNLKNWCTMKYAKKLAEPEKSKPTAKKQQS